MVVSAVVIELEAALQPWPPARRTGALIVAHPAWEDARNAILDLAAEGPVTVALVGPPGTGKTWLLRELASCLGDHGFPTMVLLQGDLPCVLADGAALLIDEALRMPEPALDDLLAQQHGVAILTDLDRFGDVVEARSSLAVVIRLRLLDAAEMAAFVAEWLREAGVSSEMLEPPALDSLIIHARGAVRLAVQTLHVLVADRPIVAPIPSQSPTQLPLPGSSIAVAPVVEPPVVANIIVAPIVVGPILDGPIVVGSIVDGPVAAEPVVAVPSGPPRRTKRRAAAAITAVAACVALAWGVATRFTTPDAPAPISPGLAGLPPLRPADVAAPMLAGKTTPAPSLAVAPDGVAAVEAQIVEQSPTAEMSTATPSPAPDPAPALPRISNVEPVALPVPLTAGQEPRPTIVPTETASASPVAVPLATVATITPAPFAAVTVASLGAQIAAAPVVPPPASRGGIGMVLLAHRGDTLQSLYRDIYRDRTAPPYAEVLAANPRTIRPGAIVVFPAPPGGWSAAQR